LKLKIISFLDCALFKRGSFLSIIKGKMQVYF